MRTRRRIFSAVMRLVLKCLRIGQRRRFWLTRRVEQVWLYGRLCLRSLLYNSFADSDAALDALFEPIYWLVDHVTRWFGVVFVVLVILLTSSVVVIVYVCLLPLVLRTYPIVWVFWHFIYGHWNLVMIIFHYYMAITTQPGCPPQVCIEDGPSLSYPSIGPDWLELILKLGSVALALGALMLWHAALITRGETSIERHINRKEKKRLRLKGKVFRNPYSYGPLGNWKVFLGIDTKRHWVTRVLLPSTHPPYGSGLSWDTPPCVAEQKTPLLAI
ncbi:hypothetical protein lerEdw1_007975 [Lerista edwardsae]|nr:hypothetical protein lerEdw1_007975 [Lerista edwardsae]